MILKNRQQKVIEETIEVLGLSEDDAITALKHHDWNIEKLQEKWFDNEEKVREYTGLTPIKYLISRDMDKQDLCYICYQKLKKESSNALKCGHFFCDGCWTDYFTEKLMGGYHCVFAKCPYYGCPLTVTHSQWKKLLRGDDLIKYTKFH